MAADSAVEGAGYADGVWLASVDGRSVAEKWLFDRPDDPILLECLGNLCINASLLGKAKDYFSAALKIKSSPGLFLKLGKVLSEIGEEEESRLMFERGLEESI